MITSGGIRRDEWNDRCLRIETHGRHQNRLPFNFGKKHEGNYLPYKFAPMSVALYKRRDSLIWASQTMVGLL